MQKRGEDISNAMPPGGTGLDRNNPQVAKLMQQQKDIIISMGANVRRRSSTCYA